MQTFIIDCARWVCGMGNMYTSKTPEVSTSETENKNRLGKRPTLLLNGTGHMCCLGQLAEQMGVPREKLYGIGMPSKLDKESSRMLAGFLVTHGNLAPTPLALAAVAVNDNEVTTVEQKIIALKRLFAVKKINLEFINTPTTKSEEAP